MAKVIERVQRGTRIGGRSPQEGAFVVIEGLAAGDAEADRLFSIVCMRYYLRDEVRAASRARAVLLPS